MVEILVRFLIGGIMVAAFSFIGSLFTPKSFGGLWGAAPSVALATLALTIGANGKGYAAAEAHSMIGGAIAFFLYASCVSAVLMRKKCSAMQATLGGMVLWFACAGTLWLVWLR